MPDHPYDIYYKQQMDAFSPGLWQNLSDLPNLDETLACKVLDYLLELACQSQNFYNIQLGRAALQDIPIDWLLPRIKIAARPLLDLNEEWEYIRLLELYETLDPDLTNELVSYGLTSPNPEIRDVAQYYNAP